tara:strand:- start:940 stop:1137 length:198 start_codon:yes stop_codon:yes gene_type:complete
MAAKKAASKKATKEVVEEVKEEPKVVMVKVLRFNPKSGERDPMEVPESDVLTHQNGDLGMKDILA